METKAYRGILLKTGLSALIVVLGAAMVVQASTSKIVYASDADGDLEIVVVNADGTGADQVTENTGVDKDPVFCGQKIVFASDRVATGKFDIFIMDIDGSNQTNLTANTSGSSEDEPHCRETINGRVIVFRSDQHGKHQIYKVNGDGTGLTRLSNNANYDDINPQWCGTQIIFARDDAGAQPCGGNPPTNPGVNFQLWIMGSDGDGCTGCTSRALTCTPYTPPGGSCDPAPLGAFEFYWPTCYPEAGGGNKIAFSAYQPALYSGRKIFRMALCSSGCCADDGGDFTRLTTQSANADVDDYPAWSLTGDFIACSSDRDGDQEIYEMPADQGDDSEEFQQLSINGDEDEDPHYGEVR